MNSFKWGDACKNISWVWFAIPNPIIHFIQTTLPLPRFVQSMTTGTFCPICIPLPGWVGTILSLSILGRNPENPLSPCHLPGSRARSGKTSALSSQSIPLSCCKNILLPGIMNQYLPLFFSSWAQLITCRLDIVVNRTSHNLHKLLHLGCYIQVPGQVFSLSMCIPRALFDVRNK